MTDAIDYLEGYERGKEVSRREAVGFIKSERKSKYANGDKYYPVYEQALENKLKEWGITNDKE